jgi:GMP synthase-like glutamine amidotransferase
MRIVCLQHVEYERPEAIAEWAATRGHALATVTPLFEEYPAVGSFDMLVVMGGPMSAYDEVASPWLAAEKRYIRDAIDSGRLVFGVCLGAQLIAEAIGGRAHPHVVREVGWFPARLTEAGRGSRVLSALPDEFTVGLWHGDTYELPAGTETAAVTEACPNQAFELAGGRVVGTQFHLEWTPEALRGLVERHGDWLSEGGRHVQSAEQFLAPGPALQDGVTMLHGLLDRMEALGR